MVLLCSLCFLQKTHKIYKKIVKYTHIFN